MPFPYDVLMQTDVMTRDFMGFRPGRVGGPWLIVQPLEYTSTAQATGYKFNLSVAGVQVEQAWNLLAPELERLAVDGRGKGQDLAIPARIASPEVERQHSSHLDPQAGRIITLYDRQQLAPAHWKHLLSRMETSFEANGIRPGPADNAGKPVSNSRFASLRFDSDANGGRLTTSELAERRLTLGGKFAGFSLLKVATPTSRMTAEQARVVRRLDRVTSAFGLPPFQPESERLGRNGRGVRVLLASELEQNGLADVLETVGIFPSEGWQGQKPLLRVPGDRLHQVTDESIGRAVGMAPARRLDLLI